MIGDIVIPTPQLVIIAWLALVLGITWIIMFGVIIRKEINGNTPTDMYKIVALACLLGFVALSVVTNLGVVINDS